MSGIDIKCVFPQLVGKFAKARGEVMLFAAAQLQTNRGLLFDAQGARNGGKRWPKPLFRNGMTLASRGTLRKSLGVDGHVGPGGVLRLTGSKIIIGSQLIYASMMNWGTTKLPGGVLRAKTGKMLRIPVPSGKRATPAAKAIRRDEGAFIFRKWVRIPERRFDVLTKTDMREIGKALSAKVAEVLNR